jgi:ABC-2 type transport system permease protein
MSWTAFTALVRRDLRLFFMDRRQVMMSFAAPILIGSFFGYLFGNVSDRPPSKIPVGFVDQDGGPIIRKIAESLSKDPVLEIKPYAIEEARASVRSGKTTVAAVIPKSFGDAAARAFLRGANKPEIQFLYDPSHGADVSMVRGIMMQHVMEVVSSEAMSGDTSSRLMEEALRDVQSARGMNPADQKALLGMLQGVGQWNQRLRASAGAGGTANRGGFSMPYTVKEEAVTARKGVTYNSMAHSFAGMSVQFILFMGVDAGMIVLLQRRTGMWKRLQAAPLSRWTVIASRATSAAIASMLILTVVFTFARIVWNVRIEGSFAGFAGVCASFSIMTAMFGLLIAVLGKTPEGARGISILVTLLLVMLGGSWVPAFLFPQWLQQISFLIPTRWAVDGLDGTIWRGFTFEQSLPAAGALLGFAVLFGLVAVWRFRWEA